VSPKRFDGWEPREVTTVTAYDGQGRPARWETVRESEWDRRQRSLVLAYQLWRAGLCRRCNEHLAHSTDPDTDPDSPEARRAWVAEPPTECFSCAALTRSERERQEDDNAPWLIHTTALVTKTPQRRQ
jgi:hypothetical protein